MSIVNVNFGFGEHPFGTLPFGAAQGIGYQGMQTTLIAGSDKPIGMQTLVTNNKENSVGMQTNVVISNSETPLGMQTEFSIASSTPIGMQSNLITGSITPTGMQGQFIIQGSAPIGMEMKADPLAHALHPTFGEYPFGTLPFGSQLSCAFMGMQVAITINESNPLGMQSLLSNEGNTDPFGMQAEFKIEAELPIGMQMTAQVVETIAMQILATIYNTVNLRIMCDFPSRGLTIASGGNNAWGNLDGIGANWIANSTEPGDFLPFNLNTDVTEQVWRSTTGTVTGLNIDCDTEIAQGVFLDTFSIQNHNFTSSANVTLIGSNVSNFASTPFSELLQVTDDNVYWIAPTLPTTGYRYWRISIDDGGNTDGFVSMGTVVFGVAAIFQLECFVDQIGFQLRDFASTVRTEGFTNVANSRTIKRVLDLEFRSLKFGDGNFEILKDVFKTQRTTLKCLYIPTPSPTDQTITDRFAVFGKLSDIPVEQHNFKGATEDYVSLSINVDESL